MGLFGSNNKEDTRAKIEELKAKMQQEPKQPPTPHEHQQSEQPQQKQESWQPPREQQTQPKTTVSTHTHQKNGILLELGEGMSLNLPIREKMSLEEFLHIADRVRELKKIERN